MKYVSLSFALVICCLFATGCPRGVETREIQVSADNDPLNEPRSILKRYAEGQAPGSEVEGFPDMVNRVKEVDAERGAILEAGLQEIVEANASQRKGMAEDLLKKLQPSIQ